MMDNDLDKRLRSLEAGQRQLAAGQEQILDLLQGVALLMQKPDEEGLKLTDVLAQLAMVITANTATLQDLKRTITQRPEGLA